MTGELGPREPCPNLNQRVRNLHDKNCFSYWKTLGYSQTTKDHRTCDSDACRANDLHPEVYHTRHVHESCNCPFIGPNPDEVASIFDGGTFPLISLSRCADVLSFQVRAYEPGVDYIAVSHALSDGRANAHDEALPTCQLNKIYNWVSNLGQPVFSVEGPRWFWMDTLCVPEHLWISTKYRKAARAAMKQTTDRARCTLVLDSDIMLLDRNCLYEEAFMRICFSSWACRMWTLQEAVLTPMVIFQLSDGVATLDEILKKYETKNRFLDLPIDPFRMYRDLRRYLSSDFTAYVARSSDHLTMLRHALEGRRTSNEADEQLIRANLLGLDGNEPLVH